MTSRTGLLLVAVVSLLVLLVGSIGESPSRNVSAGMVFGLSYSGVGASLDDATVGRILDDAVALRVTWIRFDLPWDLVQPSSPLTYDWSKVDRLVNAANARHLSMLPIIQFTPSWARPPTCTSSDHCAPANPVQYATFARAAAARYAPMGIHTWELWNEPNLGGAWMPAANVNQYATLVKATSPAIHSVDTSALILSGGLAPAATVGGDITQLDFLQGFAQCGGLAYVGAVGYHPYSSPVPPSWPDPGNAWQQISTTPRSFKSILVSFGYPNLKVEATEYGAPTNGPGAVSDVGNYNLSNHPDHVTEALQAQMATESVSLAKQDPIMGSLFWYTHYDAGTDTSNRENFFGLRRYDGSAKPAYGAYQTAVTP